MVRLNKWSDLGFHKHPGWFNGTFFPEYGEVFMEPNWVIGVVDNIGSKPVQYKVNTLDDLMKLLWAIPYSIIAPTLVQSPDGSLIHCIRQGLILYFKDSMKPWWELCGNEEERKSCPKMAEAIIKAIKLENGEKDVS